MITFNTRTHAGWAAALALAALWPQAEAQAHGTMIHPYSRVYYCAQGNIENPTDPACRAATQVGGTQAFYDWMSINQANANDNHRAVVPDGKLCSGNNATFRGLDLARDDWQATDIAVGSYEFQFRGTAPHATREWAFYITREGWDPNMPLRWNDLEHFCSIGNTPVVGGIYRLQCTIPQRTGRHVIYNTWQRSDSTEAFYTCMDVKFAGGGNPPPPPQWRDAGPLTAQNDHPIGTTVSVRVFNADGSDAERIDTVLMAGQTTASAWPLRVAQNVNAQASTVRIGVLQNGAITPVPAATGNRVYLNGSGRSHQIDVRLPDPPQPPEPPGPTPDYDYVYPAGIGQYVPGQTVVKASDGKLYGCKPFPEGAWCNIDADAYRPGTGWAWRDAWIPY